jgi:hypothetical protein
MARCNVITACLLMLASLVPMGCSNRENAADGHPAGQGRVHRPVGFEILEIQSFTSIRAWVSRDITRKEFEELRLPLGWFKNQIREADVDGGRFHNSPGMAEGLYRDKEMFGFKWRHVATVTRVNRSLDTEGLLRGALVSKSHEIRFDAGHPITALRSPEGAVYVRITRDADRGSDVPTIPESWRLIRHTTAEKLVFQLPQEVLVIRADNQDSFQGPVSGFDNLQAVSHTRNSE